jgi:superoxide dismutase, Cu-Zn family
MQDHINKIFNIFIKHINIKYLLEYIHSFINKMNSLLFIIIMILIIIQIWLWVESGKYHHGIATILSVSHPDESHRYENNEYLKIHGLLHFDGDFRKNQMHIYGELQGLPPGEHGIHIHEKGNAQKCCEKLGDHYNPLKRDHAGLVGCNRHLGDLGNIIVDNFGKTYVDIMAPYISINGKYSILGRSIVIHQNKDDLGLGNNDLSKKNGNSGARIAYGIIGLE